MTEQIIAQMPPEEQAVARTWLVRELEIANLEAQVQRQAHMLEYLNSLKQSAAPIPFEMSTAAAAGASSSASPVRRTLVENIEIITNIP